MSAPPCSCCNEPETGSVFIEGRVQTFSAKFCGHYKDGKFYNKVTSGGNSGYTGRETYYWPEYAEDGYTPICGDKTYGGTGSVTESGGSNGNTYVSKTVYVYTEDGSGILQGCSGKSVFHGCATNDYCPGVCIEEWDAISTRASDGTWSTTGTYTDRDCDGNIESTTPITGPSPYYESVSTTVYDPPDFIYGNEDTLVAAVARATAHPGPITSWSSFAYAETHIKYNLYGVNNNAYRSVEYKTMPEARINFQVPATGFLRVWVVLATEEGGVTDYGEPVEYIYTIAGQPATGVNAATMRDYIALPPLGMQAQGIRSWYEILKYAFIPDYIPDDPPVACGSTKLIGFPMPEAKAGCMDDCDSNYDALATCDDGTSCAGNYVCGCTDHEASNYDPSAIRDDGSCWYEEYE